MESSRELRSPSLMIPQLCGGLNHLFFCDIILLSCCLILFGRSIYFGAEFSRAVFSFSSADLLAAVLFFSGHISSLLKPSSWVQQPSSLILCGSSLIMVSSCTNCWSVWIRLKQLRPSTRIGRWNSTTSCLSVDRPALIF